LCLWLERLDESFARAEAAVGRDVARAYRLYLAVSAAAFRRGTLSVYQLLLAKPDARRRPAVAPHTRAEWMLPTKGT
jgi:cyclopropane-fatty-acyl-phospholipid synthase